MAPLKSPAPNGFSTYFYQSYWHIVGNEICKMVFTFLNDGVFASKINFTYIVFIPKFKNPSQPSIFGPLVYVMVFTSLCLRY